MFYVSETSLWLLCGKWITERQSTEVADGGLVEVGEEGGIENAFERVADRTGDGQTRCGGE